MFSRKHLEPAVVTAGGVNPAAAAMVEAGPAKTATWTQGSVLLSRLMGFALGAAIVCGPLALAGIVAQGVFAPAPTAVRASVTPGLTAAQQDAGAYAVSYVGAWFDATSSDSSELATFTTTSMMSFPLQATQYRDIQVASTSPASAGIVRVVVSAAVQQGATEATWPRRYYTVTVDVAQDPRLTVIGLPSPTTGPTASSQTVTLNYPNTTATNSAAGQTIATFLNAYLAGKGDITLVLTPGTVIHPIHPTPYPAVTVTSIVSDVNIPADAGNGTVVHVLVQAQLGASSSTQTPSTYLLRLRSRADRWEVDGIDTYPAIPPTNQ